MSITWMSPRGVFFQSLYQSYYTNPVSPEFLSSPSFKCVNPRHHVVGTDKVVQRFPAAAVAGLSDEQVLAMFSRGFSQGFEPDPQRLRIWNRTEVPVTSFLSEAAYLAPLSFWTSTLQTHQTQTIVRAILTTDLDRTSSLFAGCHRFQITRLPASSVEPGSGSGIEEPQVELQLQHFRCNPQENVASVAEYVERVHYAYAKALFANGVQSVLSSSPEQSSLYFMKAPFNDVTVSRQPKRATSRAVLGVSLTNSRLSITGAYSHAHGLSCGETISGGPQTSRSVLRTYRIVMYLMDKVSMARAGSWSLRRRGRLVIRVWHGS